MSKPALSAAAVSQRAVFHENGHTGSSHNPTVLGALSGVRLSVNACSFLVQLRAYRWHLSFQSMDQDFWP